MQSTSTFAEILRQAGFRATPGKIKLLGLLAKATEPLTVAEIQRALKPAQDTVTLYRSLEALTKAGVVSRSELGHGHAHYELLVGKKHHHHVVCTTCGAVEDIEGCSVKELQDRIAKKSQKFTSIYSHNVEFFGACQSCSH